MPRKELVDSFLLEGRYRGIDGACIPQSCNPAFPSPKVGLDAIAKVAAGKSAEAGLGGEVVLPGAINRDKGDSPKGAEKAQSLAHGALAQLQPDD